MTRGFFCLALDRPHNNLNVGSVLRNATCFGAAMVIIHRPVEEVKKRIPTDTPNCRRHLPVVVTDDLLSAVPLATEIVAVEVLDDVWPLPSFNHPERACYVFGPENGGLSDEILTAAHRKVTIPTKHCLNLAVATGIVAYSRQTYFGDRP